MPCSENQKLAVNCCPWVVSLELSVHKFSFPVSSFGKRPWMILAAAVQVKNWNLPWRPILEQNWRQNRRQDLELLIPWRPHISEFWRGGGPWNLPEREGGSWREEAFCLGRFYDPAGLGCSGWGTGVRNQGNGAWGQLRTQGARVQGPESGLPGPTSCQVPRKKRRWAPRTEALLRNKKRPLGLHSAWATSWGARVWCTG